MHSKPVVVSYQFCIHSSFDTGILLHRITLNFSSDEPLKYFLFYQFYTATQNVKYRERRDLKTNHFPSTCFPLLKERTVSTDVTNVTHHVRVNPPYRLLSLLPPGYCLASKQSSTKTNKPQL